ncbi:MAG: amidohydrolase family protein [Planctomycetia bacterium]|nr:amidohydrolase family protein [Planctomycetia bacterium]
MRRAFRARYVFPVAGPPIEGGVLTVEGQRIVAVGTTADGDVQDVTDFGNAAIIPGIVNAHTHLEFSDLTAPLSQPGVPLADWIRAVIAWRRECRGDVGSAVHRGVRESQMHGTTALGEIATAGWGTDDPGVKATLESAALGTVVFRELIGLRAASVPGRLTDAQAFLNIKPKYDRWRHGLSPHAPYTVHPELLRQCVELAATNRLPVAMHLAETREELELLAGGTGPLRRLLEELGQWEEGVLARGSRPLDYLREIVKAPRALVIHGNYLADDEVEFLAEHAATMSIVYCPRTHAYFGHDEYPLAKMLRRGVHVALGTDSRASNPDLNLWEEMRFVAERGTIAPAVVLEMGTLAGARALARGGEIGSLERGKFADFCAFALPVDKAREPHEWLLDRAAKLVAAYWRGESNA